MIRLIRLNDVKKLTGLSRSSIYAMINTGRFPRQVRLGERAVAWPEPEISDWIEQRIEKSSLQEGPKQ